MTILLAVCAAVVFGVSVYLLLGRELKGVAMGVFLISHGVHLGILAMSGQPIVTKNGSSRLMGPPILGANEHPVDPLPQALILTSIVISFAVMAFLLTLLVTTQRRSSTLEVNKLATEGRPIGWETGAGETDA